MNLALPISLVAGDRGTYECKITGGYITKAIFSIDIDLEDGYILDISGQNSVIKENSESVFIFLAADGYFAQESPRNADQSNITKIIVNCVINVDNTDSDTNIVTFILPSSLTKCFKAANYTYDISVVEYLEGENADEYYTPIYSNGFSVYTKRNKII